MVVILTRTEAPRAGKQQSDRDAGAFGIRCSAGTHGAPPGGPRAQAAKKGLAGQAGEALDEITIAF